LPTGSGVGRACRSTPEPSHRSLYGRCRPASPRRAPAWSHFHRTGAGFVPGPSKYAGRGNCREVAPPVIEFINVSKVYPNGVTALEDVSLHVERGEFVFLVGPSGAGKSTLVRLIYREETPTRGIVLVDGLNLGRLRRRDVPFLRRQMGVV